MENLSGILTIVDRHSSVIPEGDYLLLCNMMKNVHIALTEKRALEPRPEHRNIENRIHTLHLKRQNIKERKNVTEKIKHMAIQERLEHLGLSGLHMDANIERLKQRGIIVGDERKFYMGFLKRYNDTRRLEIAVISQEINRLRAMLLV